MERLKRSVFYGARNLVPSKSELETIIKQTSLQSQVVFMDGFVVDVRVYPETVAQEIFGQAIKNIGLRNTQYFSLYEVSNDLERSMRDEENIGDLIAKWDQYRQIISAKGLQVEYNFVIKKQIYLTPHQDPSDPLGKSLWNCTAFSLKLIKLI